MLIGKEYIIFGFGLVFIIILYIFYELLKTLPTVGKEL